MENEINNIKDPESPSENMTEAEKTTEFYETSEPTKSGSYLNLTVFLIILLVGGILSITLPHKKISEIEKRNLTGMPTLTWDSVFHGKYTQKFENYYADNFPFRENLMGASIAIKNRFGYRPNGMMVYNFSDKVDAGKQEDTTETDAQDVENHTDSTTASADTLKNDAEIVKSVIIYGGRAIQIFGGSKRAAESYAELINTYHKTLGPSVKVYCLVIPTPTDFYLPDKYKHVSQGEKKNIAMINAYLDTGIVRVNSYDEVEAHKNEYLYYNTDHHWTGRGAYYAYRGFCKATGIKPYELNQLQRKVIPHFLGSLYDLTRDERLKANIDSVEYFMLPFSPKTTIYRSPDLKSSIKSSLFASMARGGNSYSVFLGGDFPLVKIESGPKNGRKLLVIKDSYGNALAPYFALHFDEVYVVDYRYFDVNLINFIRDKRITDMIFMHNTFVANAKYTTKREYFLMRKKNNMVIKTTKKDSTSGKKVIAAPKDSAGQKQ